MNTATGRTFALTTKEALKKPLALDVLAMEEGPGAGPRARALCAVPTAWPELRAWHGPWAPAKLCRDKAQHNVMKGFLTSSGF